MATTKSARIEVNRKAIVELLSSQAVADNLEGRGDRIAAAAGDGFEVDVTKNRDRVVVFVRTTDYDSRKAEAEDRALTRAIDAGR